MHLLAIEIGGTKLQICAGDGTGTLLERRRRAVDRAAGAEGIRAHLAEALPELIERWRPRAIGAGFGGPVRWRTGQIVQSHQVAGWSDFPLGAWLAEQSGLPAFVENDANAAALGEALHGAGQGFDPVFYTTLGSGVGGGLVAGGALYHGAEPGEAELGHLRLREGGPILEERCSGWAVDRRVRSEIEAEPGSLLARLAAGEPPGGEARLLGPALAAGDPAALRLLAETAADLAFGLSQAVHLLNPALLVLGGGLALLGEPLRAAVAASLPERLMPALRPGPRVALAALREDAVPVGALALAAQRLGAA